MRITESAALSMQDIAKRCLVGVKDVDYNNPITFKETWYHEDKNEHTEWCEAIHKEIADMTRHQVWERTKRIKSQPIED